MLTVPEAAARTGRSPETIRRWIRAGKLPATKVGTQHVIDEHDLARLIEQRGKRAASTRAAEASLPYSLATAAEHEPNPLLARITVDPGIAFGKPVIRGTRIPVELILNFMAGGWSTSDFLDGYPGITEADLHACIAYAAEIVATERIYPIPPS